MAEGRILYVEDNFDNRILIKRVLEAEGYTVIEAGDGREGLKLAHTASPDLILMDINLPDVDGYECTRRLRASEPTRDIPILALTANVLDGDKQKALGVGCNGYVSKPIDVDELPYKIATHLRAAAQAGQTAQAPARAGLLSRVDGHEPADGNPPGAVHQGKNGRPDADGRSHTVETPAGPSRHIGASTHDRSNAL
jgi:two-component system cell cycle response regulator DivK